jgi:hypothetical protein
MLRLSIDTVCMVKESASKAGSDYFNRKTLDWGLTRGGILRAYQHIFGFV